MKTFTFTILALLISITTFSQDVIKGSGKIVTQERNLEAFTSVSSTSSFDVNIIQGASQKVTVSGYENLVDLVDLLVSDGKLRISFKKQRNQYINNVNIKVNIVIPELNAITLSGSGDIDIENFKSSKSLKCSVAGSGNISFKNCSCQNATFAVNGSGNVDAFSLTTNDAAVTVNGSGNVDLNCAGNLDVSIAGSGNVNYSGDPKVTKSIAGSGNVRKH
jgi:hypothetical protein